MGSSAPLRVAIVGGGCAGVTAAFELTNPSHAGRYEVTVYQLGWRLGGKGASGRGAADRIEEHGLHLWMGFYENAFELLRRCYEELARDPKRYRITHWREAIHPDPHCGVMDRSPSGRWLPWTVFFPPADGTPGDRGSPLPRFSVVDYLRRCIALLRSLFQAIQLRGGLDREGTGVAPAREAGSRSTPAYAARLEETLDSWFKYAQLATLGAWLEGLRWAELMLSQAGAGFQPLTKLYDRMTSAVQAQLERVIDDDDELRRLWELADLVLAVIRGVYRFELITDPRGFDAIDHYDCREWLRLNGASERALDSAFLRALYDLAFAYEDGDVTRPRIAAGQALRGAVRAFFTYRGAFFWKMQAGMGDVVFAPFYQLLHRRGVRFEFFHRLENVRLGSDGQHVAALEFDVQARILKGEYQPLVDVRRLPCWPAEPDWSQLEDGDRLQAEGVRFESFWDRRHVGSKVLRVMDDFDLVVLAVGVGTVPYVCKELISSSERWRGMVEHVKSVPTQALQLWMNQDMSALGWPHPQINLSGFAEPFDTWADMRQLIPEESFAGDVRAVAYFCGVLADEQIVDALQDPEYPALRYQEVKQNAVRFLDGQLRELWPGAVDEKGFHWDLLVDPLEGAQGASRSIGADRLGSQYWTANVNPSDRYSLSLPDSLRHRISPLDRTFDNLTIAGDWTDTGFNEGCVEAAVMSGRLAAHALSQSPPLEEIVGFDHP